MKHTFLTLIIILFCSPLNAQDKIAHKIYSYGQVENSIQGKTLVHYLMNDAKGEVKIIDLFKDFEVDAQSWNKLFIPDFNYTIEEITDVFTKNDIKTLVLIKINNVATANTGISTILRTSNNSAGAFTSSSNKVTNVNLSFEIYNYTNNFSKPVCVINGEATNAWRGGQRGITVLIVNRILNALEDQKAF